MPRFFIRSTIFNLCFYILTGISCIVLLPTLLFPRKFFMGVVHGFVYTTAVLEKYILGLRYEVRGLENIPKDGAYIVAAKHESAYETFKLHILFKDPAIVLKKELLKIPLWGKYLGKSDVIAIDRTSPKLAIQSIQDGANRVAAQGREIIIFPQGTRVSPDLLVSERPYKIGIVRIQEATGLPIIPLAMNSGVFYPKGKWIKKPGCVVFEFLPAILAGGEPSATLKQIENVTEEKSAALRDEGRQSLEKRKKGNVVFLISSVVILYCAYWMLAAHLTRNAVERFLTDLKQNPDIIASEISAPKIGGFPFKISLNFPGKQSIRSHKGDISLENLTAQSLPALGMPIELKAEKISLQISKWKNPVDFDTLYADLTFRDKFLTLRQAEVHRGNFKGNLLGNVNFKTEPHPDIDLKITIENYGDFISELSEKNIIKPKQALIALTALTALQKDGVVTTTITRQDNSVYLGMIRIAELPKEEQ